MSIPLAVMTYVNPVLSFGVDAFAGSASAVGVDGVIIPDLPLDEAAGVRQALHGAGVAMIPLVAPTTTPDRLARICSTGAGFVYCVGVTGVTGARRTIAGDAIALLDSVRAVTPLPRALGFGLSTHEHLEALRGHAEAAVVGSALLDAIGIDPGGARRRCRAVPRRDDRSRGSARGVSQERVSPVTRIDGEVTVPGDKSISHRALILGSLAKGRTYIGNASPAADVLATAACLRACGVWVRDFPPARYALDGAGVGVSLRSPDGVLDCANSGTTMRLLAGVIAGSDCEATLEGDESLRRRPMMRVVEPLRAMGAELEPSPQGTAPLRVRGSRESLAVDLAPGDRECSGEIGDPPRRSLRGRADHRRRAGSDARSHRADAPACAGSMWSSSGSGGHACTLGPSSPSGYGCRAISAQRRSSSRSRRRVRVGECGVRESA